MNLYNMNWQKSNDTIWRDILGYNTLWEMNLIFLGYNYN